MFVSDKRLNSLLYCLQNFLSRNLQYDKKEILKLEFQS